MHYCEEKIEGDLSRHTRAKSTFNTHIAAFGYYQP